MNRCAAIGVIVALLGCQPSDYAPLDKASRLTGTLDVSAQVRGAAWVFLFDEGQGFPVSPALPRYATAVSDLRRQQVDARFIFAAVQPNPWRLWGFIDADANFDPSIDVLAQPTFNDLIGEAVELNLQPGKSHETTLTFNQRLARDPPAFRLEGSDADIRLDATQGGIRTISVVPYDANGRLREAGRGFAVGLNDADGDGRPDDADGDGLPDLSLQAVLRFQPRPGQTQEGVEIVVPLVLTNAAAIAESFSAARPYTVLERLDWLVLPQAFSRLTQPGQKPVLTALPAPPAGEYELVLLNAQGTLWRIPNRLGQTDGTQATRFHFDRRGG
ncbi:MAG: hypothetical protein K1X64_03760 [Myxococcaceae bacterium]|nr:hypothetical protein [Myxococcaceae bacterium]